MKEQVIGFLESNGVRPHQRQHLIRADLRQLRLDLGGVDGRGFLARQSKQYRAIGSMAFSRQRQRTVQIHAHGGDLVQNSVARQFQTKLPGRPHGSHGV